MKAPVIVLLFALASHEPGKAADLGRDLLGGLLDPLKKQSSNTVYNLSDRAVSKFASSLLPEDVKAFTNGNVLTVQDGSWRQVTTNVATPPKQYLVRPSETDLKRSRVLTPGKMVLDEKVVQGKIPGRLALQVDHSPLPWNPTNRAYATQIKVGLETEGKTSPRLDKPITINLTGNEADVKPTSVSITSLGQIGFVPTEVACVRHDAHAKVILHSDWGERAFEIPLGPHTDQLKILASETRIFGFGLGTMVLTVTRLAEDGRELSDSNSVTVNLNVDHGKLESSFITIPPERTSGSVKLRSVGLGASKVSAKLDSSAAAAADLQFVFPISYIAAAILGGCLGGVGRWYKEFKSAAPSQQSTRKRGRHLKPKNVDKMWGHYVCEGCLVGILIVSAVAAGMVITQLPTNVIGTELGALVIGTAGGFCGTPLLEIFRTVLGQRKRAR